MFYYKNTTGILQKNEKTSSDAVYKAVKTEFFIKVKFISTLQPFGISRIATIKLFWENFSKASNSAKSPDQKYDGRPKFYSNY
jgi:hypothetical protein